MLKYYLKKYHIYNLILYFLIYSFIGWLIEIFVIYAENGYLSSRGFVYGPFCIIYGFGMLTLILLLKPLEKNLLIYFFASALLISFLEYVTGFTMEIIFHSRWWDYSNIPYNINGYVCLRNSVTWGLLSIIFMKHIHPVVEKSILNMPQYLAEQSSYGIILFFIVNIVLSIRNYLR